MKPIKRILISQPLPPAGHNPYEYLVKQYGVELDFFQLIHIEGLEVQEFRQQRINPLNYSAVLFSSTLAVDHYFRICELMRVQVPETMHYYCISDAVGNYLQHYIQYRKRKVFPAPNHKFEDLLPAMKRRPNETYLMVVSETHSDSTIQMLAGHGIEVKPAVMYRTCPSEWPKDKPFDYDMIALFTPQGMQAIRNNFPDWQQGDTALACLGAKTAQAIEEAGYRVDIQAGTPPLTSMTAAIEDYLEKSNKA